MRLPKGFHRPLLSKGRSIRLVSSSLLSGFYLILYPEFRVLSIIVPLMPQNCKGFDGEREFQMEPHLGMMHDFECIAVIIRDRLNRETVGCAAGLDQLERVAGIKPVKTAWPFPSASARRPVTSQSRMYWLSS